MAGRREKLTATKVSLDERAVLELACERAGVSLSCLLRESALATALRVLTATTPRDLEAHVKGT